MDSGTPFRGVERLWRRGDELAAALKTKLPHVMRLAEGNFEFTLGPR